MQIYKRTNKKIKQLIGLQCDTCPKRCDFDHIELIKLEKGETNKYDFCSYKCLLTFVLNEIKKENPRSNIITGGKK
jgi:translation initiation factor RLI1